MIYKKDVNPKTGEPVKEVVEETVEEVVEEVKAEPHDMQVIIIETKEIKVIRKSEYNSLIHICI
jgi:ssRNA-specific RNase YbeY (16S rRNA maturation enzyme)